MRDIFHEIHTFTQSWEAKSLDAQLEQDLQSVLQEAMTQRKLVQNTADGCNGQRLCATWQESDEEDSWNIDMPSSVHAHRHISGYPHSHSHNHTHSHAQQCAKNFLQEHIWQGLQCAKLPQALAAVLYDSAVHMGKSEALRLMQQACNVVGDAHLDDFTPVAEKGIFHIQLLQLTKNLHEHGLAFYTARLCVRQRLRWYAKYAQKNPSQNNLAQYKARCQALLEFLALLERDYH